jgi:hypothetical protein
MLGCDNMERLITGIDLGSSYIKVAVCIVDRRRNIELLSLDSAVSNSIKAGNIVDLDIACRDVRTLLKRTEKRINRKIRYITVAIKGAGIEIQEAKGMIPLSKKPREIWQADIDKCVKAAGMIEIPEGRQIVQKTIKSCYINEGDIVTNPIGLYASKLGISLSILTADSSKIKNIYKCIEHSGYLLRDIVLGQSAIVESVFSDSGGFGEGALLIDIGSDLTMLSFVRDNTVEYINCIKKGAKDLDSEEDVKNYLKLLKNMCTPKSVQKAIFTGGGALKENLLEKAEAVFDIKCEPGHVRLKWCSMSPSDAVRHTTSLGIAAYEARRIQETHVKNSPIRRFSKFFLNLLEDYF